MGCSLDQNRVILVYDKSHASVTADSLLTLVVELGRLRPRPRRILDGIYALRPCEPGDAPELGRLFWQAYGPGVAADSYPAACQDVEAAFAGVYGDLWLDASPVAYVEPGEIVAAVEVVSRAPWHDTPRCPFIIEVFVAKEHRRKGLATALLTQAFHVLELAGETHASLRVRAHNQDARHLYQGMGFVEWRSG